MKIIDLNFENFRNLQPGTFAPTEGVNIIYGDNAEGKTNLIEAVWLFCGARSFRGTKDRDLVKIGADFSKLQMNFFSQEREQNAEITIESRRKAKRGGIDLPASKLSEAFSAVVFSPSHLSLIKDGPEMRRKFIDGAISQNRPGYTTLLAEYQRALMQRNSVLRDAGGHTELLSVLESFEERIALYGERIIKTRKNYIDALCRYAPKIYAGLSGGKEELTLNYSPKSGESKEALSESLKAFRNEDIRTGCTSQGPHRDDLDIAISGMSARLFGSQGQQRSAVLALKLSEVSILENALGERPVVLLDDVMSELDPGRQDYVLNHIGASQIILTCCDPAEIMRLMAGGIYYMKNGVITPKK